METRPFGARGPDTRRVAAPAAPGQPLPSPRPSRNPTRRSLPPASRLLGPGQSLGSAGSLAPFSGRPATRPAEPSVPFAFAAAPGHPNPRFPSARPGPPFPGHPAPPSPKRRPAPPPAPGRTGAPRSYLGSGVESRSPPRPGRDAAVPSPQGPAARRCCSPSSSSSCPRPPPLDTYGLLPPQTQRLGGGEGRVGGSELAGPSARRRCREEVAEDESLRSSPLLARVGEDGVR